jgi:hypothetical protein
MERFLIEINLKSKFPMLGKKELESIRILENAIHKNMVMKKIGVLKVDYDSIYKPKKQIDNLK